MGWMEILAALQKVVPLLTRAVPMLEVFLASRNTSASNDEVKASLAAFQTAVENEAAARHAKLSDAVVAQTEQTALLRADLSRLQTSLDERDAAERADRRSLAKALRLVSVMVGFTLLLCLGILVLLVFRHG